MERTFDVVGIVGSLRRESYNRKLLAAAASSGAPAFRIAPFDVRDIPLYDADRDIDAARPAAVTALRRAIADADGVLIAMPEYNHSVPGLLQNAIDWVSRPAMRSPLAEKPVAIMGASQGGVGTARGQQVLKLVLASTLSLVLPHPGMIVGNAAMKFDASGALTDEPTRQFLAAFLRDFARWIGRVGARDKAAARDAA